METTTPASEGRANITIGDALGQKVWSTDPAQLLHADRVVTVEVSKDDLNALVSGEAEANQERLIRIMNVMVD